MIVENGNIFEGEIFDHIYPTLWHRCLFWFFKMLAKCLRVVEFADRVSKSSNINLANPTSSIVLRMFKFAQEVYEVGISRLHISDKLRIALRIRGLFRNYIRTLLMRHV